MASSSLGMGGGGKCCGGGYKPCRLDLITNHQACSSFMVTMINHQNKPRKGRVFAAISSMTLQSSSTTTSIMQRRQYSITHKQDREQQQPPPPPVISHEKMDEWMREAVVEIVKNVGQAPLLLHVNGDGSGNNNKGKEKTTSLEMEKGVKEEIWADVLEKKPEGVIFVGRIEEAEAEAEAAEEVVVGVVVQGRGGGHCGVGPVCYLLKTNRVGPACYFCLVRVKSFGETAKKQLQDCWLLRNLNNSYHSW